MNLLQRLSLSLPVHQTQSKDTLTKLNEDHKIGSLGKFTGEGVAIPTKEGYH